MTLPIPRKKIIIQETLTQPKDQQGLNKLIEQIVTMKYKLETKTKTQKFKIDDETNASDIKYGNTFNIVLEEDHESIIPSEYKVNLQIKIYFNDKPPPNIPIDIPKCNNDTNNDDLTNFILKWEDHRKAYYGNIPDIYLYGDVYDNKNTYIGYYYITRYYRELTDLFRYIRERDQICNLYRNILKFISKLIGNKHTCINFDKNNLGVELVDDNTFEIVLINYNFNSIQGMQNANIQLIQLKKDDINPSYYMMLDETSYQKYDYIYLYGLLDISLILFETQIAEIKTYTNVDYDVIKEYITLIEGYKTIYDYYLQEYIDSYKDDANIKAVMKKIKDEITNDTTGKELTQICRFDNIPEFIIYTDSYFERKKTNQNFCI